MGVNFGGVVNGVQTFVPRMIDHGKGGYIVNTASIAGIVSAGPSGIYCASKFAVVGLSIALQQSLAAHDIGVSVVCPGNVNTNIADACSTRPAHLGDTGYHLDDSIVDAFRGHNLAERPFHLIVGLLGAKDAGGVIKPFAGRATAVHAVPIEGHEHHAPEAVIALARENGLPAEAAAGVAEAMARIGRAADRARPPVVLIAGSLYLAGQVLEANGQAPS